MEKIMYHVDTVYNKITHVVVIGETEQFVQIQGKSVRNKKTTEWECIRNTADEAKQWLIEKYDNELSTLLTQFESRKEHIEKKLKVAKELNLTNMI